MKQIEGIYSAARPHWVGDGFPVRTLFSYDRSGEALSPFLMLDYAGPAQFAPTPARRGVGEHPHRGFETVTIVYQGEVEHRDSTGAGGLIGAGDVQWMTAAGGIMHEEMHSADFARSGGFFQLVQLWVNLPAKDKMGDPGYQTLLSKDIPKIGLAGDAGTVRIIAGDFQGHRGPAATHTPINVWDLRLVPGARASLALPEDHTTIVVVLDGTVQVNDSAVLREAQFVHLSRAGSRVDIESNDAATLLVLTGEPIREPIAGGGPFVMNTVAEVEQAFADLRQGRFARVPAVSS
jgi:quercetin 2,3-dioxygenase